MRRVMMLSFIFCLLVAVVPFIGGAKARADETAKRSKIAVLDLRDQGVGTLICGGLQSSFEDLLRAGGILVFSWVSGDVEELLELFLVGRLAEEMGHSAEGDVIRLHSGLRNQPGSSVIKTKK